jgi:hypothetical protein
MEGATPPAQPAPSASPPGALAPTSQTLPTTAPPAPPAQPFQPPPKKGVKRSRAEFQEADSEYVDDYVSKKKRLKVARDSVADKQRKIKLLESKLKILQDVLRKKRSRGSQMNAHVPVSSYAGTTPRAAAARKNKAAGLAAPAGARSFAPAGGPPRKRYRIPEKNVLPPLRPAAKFCFFFFLHQFKFKDCWSN